MKFSECTWYKIEFGKEKGHLEALSKKVNFMSEIFARRSSRKEHLRKPHDKKSAPAKQQGIRREKYTLKAEDKATLNFPMKIKAPVLVSKNTEARMFVVDSGASIHMLSKTYLRSDEMETLRRSRTPPTVVTANGEVQTNEEAQVYVEDLDLFVTVQLLEETPAVLRLESFAQSTDVHMSEKTAKLHN